MKTVHPTKKTLIDAVAKMMDEISPEQITSEMVLQSTGISKGSLYHHFSDYQELLEAAEIQRFTEYVDSTLDALAIILDSTGSREELQTAFVQVAKIRQQANSEAMRFERAYVAGAARYSPKLRELLGAEQERITERFIEIIQICQDRGWARTDFDARAIAVLMQSTMIGRVIDDISPVHMESDEWVRIIQFLLETILFANE